MYNGIFPSFSPEQIKEHEMNFKEVVKIFSPFPLIPSSNHESPPCEQRPIRNTQLNQLLTK